MRSFLLILLTTLLLGTDLPAQIFNPVEWETSYEQVGDHEFDLIFTANIDEGWVIYSQYLEGDDGPVPTAFYFDEGDHYDKIGKNKESGNRKEAHDKVFDMTLIKFSKKGVFTQRVKVSDLRKPVTGYLEFMTCDDERCLPPSEVDFSFQLEAKKQETAKTVEEEKEPAKVAESESKTDDTGATTEQAPLQVEVASEEAPLVIGGADVNSNLIEPVQWSLTSNKVEEGVYELQFKAELDENWSIYSQYLESDDGPLRTKFHYEDSTNLSFLGKNEESGGRKEAFDKIFEMNVIKFSKKAVFTQKVKVNDPNKPLSGWVEYMTCDDAKCLTSDIGFKVNFTEGIALIGEEAEGLPGMTGKKVSLSEEYWGIPKPDAPINQCGDVVVEEADKTYWSIFILGFLGGLLALLTPCVFPMIPLTVSFFTKSSEDKKKGLVNATMYGLFILLVYLILSIPFHLMDSINPDILNDISTNIWLNLAFFAIFLFFAFSFFGYYELTLPSSWTNRVSAAEGVGGMLGIFFMALTLALVSFSCTGPILGSLLAGALSSDGGAWQLTAGMGGFGLALALPFALFAAFPGWMNSLPKSGGWLTTVKVVLGFLELALALKFLSNADLVKHWEVLKIEPFLILWILIFVGMGLYLFGKIKFPHDSPTKKLSWGRKGLGIVSFAFAIYLATGFIYDEEAGSFRSLKLLSGLAPPACYSWIYPCDCPQNFSCFKDFQEGLAYAKEVNKPILIDFTGHACVNCRKMEEQVWPKPGVKSQIMNNYVLISLYVDEKIELPEEEKELLKKATGRPRVENFGHKWSQFQIEYFNNNSQPYYVLLSPDGQLLNQPVGYTPDAQEYEDFLECGLDSFEELTKNGGKTDLKPIGSSE